MRFGMRLRTAAAAETTVPDDGSVAKLEDEISAWRQQLSSLGSDRAALQQQSKEANEDQAASTQRALATLELSRQRLIWNIRESEHPVLDGHLVAA